MLKYSICESICEDVPLTLQGDNGRLEVWLEGCDTFEVVPSRVLNEATLILRVKNSSALDYEVVQNISFQVRCLQRSLSKGAVFHGVDLAPSIFDVNCCISCLYSDTQKMYINTFDVLDTIECFWMPE